jgi:hypothetical protein
MAQENGRNDIPWAEEARDYCNDHQVAGTWAGGAVAGAATKATLDSAGVFAAGAGLGFAISGNEPGAVVAGSLATGFLNPAVQTAAVSGAVKGSEVYLTQHWAPMCDGVADGINATADGALAVSQFLENAPAPSYVDAKLGYDPAVASAPTFETGSSATQDSTGPTLNAATPSFDWPSWGLSDVGAPTSAPPLDAQPSSPDTSTQGFGVFFGGGSDGATSIWGGSSSSDASAPASLFGGSADTSVSSVSTSSNSDTSTSSSGGWGSLFGGSSATASYSDSGSGSSTSSSQTDWGGGSSESTSSGSSSSSHDSGLGSVDGGL